MSDLNTTLDEIEKHARWSQKQGILTHCWAGRSEKLLKIVKMYVGELELHGRKKKLAEIFEILKGA